MPGSVQDAAAGPALFHRAGSAVLLHHAPGPDALHEQPSHDRHILLKGGGQQPGSFQAVASQLAPFICNIDNRSGYCEGGGRSFMCTLVTTSLLRGGRATARQLLGSCKAAVLCTATAKGGANRLVCAPLQF